MISAILRIRSRAWLWLATRDIAQSRRHDALSTAALDRSEMRINRARALADRFANTRPTRPPCPAGDLLHGSKAIAAHLGVTKGIAIHLIRSRSIPWFALGGVACARRSTLAAHFAALEAGGTSLTV